MARGEIVIKSTGVRALGASIATALVLLAATASANGQGTSQEFLPDCGATQTTDCVVSTEINGAPTNAIKANVAKQSGPIEGSYFQIYFTQPNPISYAPTFVCPDGTPAQTTIVDGQPALICTTGGTPTPVAPKSTCPNGFTFAGYGRTVRCGDLTSVAPPGTKIGVTVNLGSGDPKAAVVRGGQLGSLATPNKTWTSDKAGGSTVVKVETVLGTSSVLYGPDGNGCRLFPTVTDCGGESAVAEWTGTWATVTLLNLDSDQARPYGEIARGMTLATNAQSNGPPLFDSAKRILSFQTGAPHFQQNGTTPNEGFIYTFLPDVFLQAGPGFGLPPGLTPQETLAMLGVDKVTAGSAAEQLEPTVSIVAGGAIYSVPKFGFSSPKFDYLPRKAVGAFTSKATATRKKVSVSLSVGGKSKVSVAGKLGSKSICAGTKSASKAGTVSVTCSLSSSGKKSLSKAKAGSRVNVKVTLKAKKTETKNTYALIP